MQIAVHPHGCGDSELCRRITRILQTVHPHGCGDSPLFPVHKNKITWFTPTGVGIANLNMLEHASQLGSPPRVWG